MRQDTQAHMEVAIGIAFLFHGIAAKAAAQNTDTRFGLTAAILSLTKCFFLKPLL